MKATIDDQITYQCDECGDELRTEVADEEEAFGLLEQTGWTEESVTMLDGRVSVNHYCPDCQEAEEEEDEE